MIATIAAKELRTMFASPVAWMVLGLMQAVLAWLFFAQLDAYLSVQNQLVNLANPPGFTELVVKPAFETSRFVLLMATPILSMRLIAEERRNQTMALLLSAPISMTQIALGKFLGLFAFLLLIVLEMVLLSLSLYAGGTPDLGLLASNAIGLALLAACFAAVGLFVSCLTAQPVAAAIGTLVALLEIGRAHV